MASSSGEADPPKVERVVLKKFPRFGRDALAALVIAVFTGKTPSLRLITTCSDVLPIQRQNMRLDMRLAQATWLGVWRGFIFGGWVKERFNEWLGHTPAHIIFSLRCGEQKRQNSSMSDEKTKEIITGSLRTLVGFVPVVGGAVAQAWSEFEGYQRNVRIEAFFAEFRSRLEALEADAPTIKERIKRMEDFSRLLEDTVDAVRRESDDRKRQVYPLFFLNLILQSETISSDERSFLLETLDSLTEYDLNVLRQFEASGTIRGDRLTQTKASSGQSVSKVLSTPNTKDCWRRS